MPSKVLSCDSSAIDSNVNIVGVRAFADSRCNAVPTVSKLFGVG